MKGARILIVEDEKIVAKTLERRLQEIGYVVTAVVSSGEEAVRKAAETSPDLILMDIRLQGEVDGIEAASRIRSRLDVPVVYLTAHADETTVERATVTEPFGYILKPFGEYNVYVAVETALYKHRAERSLRESERFVRAAIDALSACLAVLDEQGAVLAVNRAWRDTAPAHIPWAENLAEGVNYLALCDLAASKGSQDAAALAAGIRAVVRGEQGEFSLEYRAPVVSRPRWFVARVTRFRDTRPVRVVVTHEDISALKHAQEALRVEVQVFTALARVGQELMACHDTQTILSRLCQLTAEVLGGDDSQTFLWHPQEQAYLSVAGWGSSPGQGEGGRQLRISHEAAAPLFARLRQDAVVTITGATVPDLSALLQTGRFVIARALCLALRRGAEPVGFQIVLYRDRAESFTPLQERIAQGIAQLASFAVENARLLQQAESANRLKSAFLATISHELRTPLQVIIGYTELLLDGEFGQLAQEQAETLRRVEKSALELLAVISAILDARLLEEGSVALELSEVSVAGLLEDIRQELAEGREKPGLHLAWHIAPDLPPVYTDGTKLRTILKNLISNAVKFTDDGEVTITARLDGEGVEFTVHDTGIGIAQETVPLLFEPFRQADASTTRRYGGLGLGLYFVRRLLDLLAGTLSVSSEVGKGSWFRVWVPKEVGERAQPASPPQARSSPS